MADRATPAASEALRQWQVKAPSSFEYADDWQQDEFEPIRIGVVIDSQDAPETLAGLQQTFGDEITSNSIYAPNYDFHVVECFAPHVSKWHGIEQLIDRLGITGDEVAAVGDDVNDVEMIRSAGLGIAMRNAVEPVKAVADLHVPTNNEHGLAEAIDIILAR
jgi:HAD superfamily hydrolase (TIGR01484 family)